MSCRASVRVCVCTVYVAPIFRHHTHSEWLRLATSHTISVFNVQSGRVHCVYACNHWFLAVCHYRVRVTSVPKPCIRHCRCTGVCVGTHYAHTTESTKTFRNHIINKNSILKESFLRPLPVSCCLKWFGACVRVCDACTFAHMIKDFFSLISIDDHSSSVGGMNDFRKKFKIVRVHPSGGSVWTKIDCLCLLIRHWQRQTIKRIQCKKHFNSTTPFCEKIVHTKSSAAPATMCEKCLSTSKI